MFQDKEQQLKELEFSFDDEGAEVAALHPLLEKVRYYIDRAVSLFSVAVLASTPSVPSEATRTQAPQAPGIQIMEPHPVSQDRIEEYNQLVKDLEVASQSETVIYGPSPSLRK